MLNIVQNTWSGPNYFTNQGNKFNGQFNGQFNGTFNGTFTGVPTLAGANTFTGVNAFSNASNVFYGNGANLTALNPANISSGTAGIAISGNAATATQVAAGGITAGAFGAITFSGNVGGTVFGTSANPIGFVGTFTGIGSGTGIFNGDGSGLNPLTAANLTGANTLPDGVLSTNVPLLNGTQTFSGKNTFSGTGNIVGDGTGLTGLSGSEFANQSANTVLAGPASGSAATPSFQTAPTISGANINALNASKLSSGTVPSARLGYKAGTVSIPINSTGPGTVTFTTAFDSTSYAISLCLNNVAAANAFDAEMYISTKSAGGFTFFMDFANVGNAQIIEWTAWEYSNS